EDSRVEPDPAARPGHTKAEVDVLHGRVRKAGCVEAARGVESIPADRPEAGPERRDGAGAGMVNVVVEEVAERRDQGWVLGLVVVGAEERCELGVGLERATDATERVGARDDVGVDEDEHLARRARRALVASRRRSRPG